MAAQNMNTRESLEAPINIRINNGDKTTKTQYDVVESRAKDNALELREFQFQKP